MADASAVAASLKVALRWDAVCFSRADVELWTGQGRTLEQAEAAAAAAGNGRWLARWARIAGSGLSADGLAEWACFGVPVGVWGEAAARGGLPTKQVQEMWRDCGSVSAVLEAMTS